MARSANETITGVERALDVLGLFAAGDAADLGVTEIAGALGLSKAVVHRILSSLRVKGYVELDASTRRYRLGPAALTLGLSYLDRLDLLGLAREAMRELVRETDETATVSVRIGWTRVYVDQVTPPRDVRMVVRLASAHPLHAGASSKAFLAFLGPETQDAYLQRPLEKVTPTTITSAAKLRRELREVRERGYATSFGERQEGAGAVAAPVLGLDGAPAAVLSVCGPVERFRPRAEACAKVLLDVTRDLSTRLGHRAA